MKKIFICTTFREFNGNENDKIQRLFLQSIVNQTYKNHELIVTIYKEKKIEETLNELKLLHSCFYSKNTECRFSLTEVLLNCIESTKNENEAIIIWTTCDVIFSNNFFQEIINNYSKNFCGTSHPHITYANTDHLNKNLPLKQIPAEGIDTIFFDSNIFKNENNKRIIKNYYFKDWGIFEHFLIAFGKKYSEKMINLWNITDISKIQNNRQLNKETVDFFNNSLNYNTPIFLKFLRNEKLSERFKFLFYCHNQFEVIDKNIYKQKFFYFNIIYILTNYITLNIKLTIKKCLRIFAPKKYT